MRRVGLVALWIVLAFFVLRALAEPFTVDLTNYSDDWGGPTLIGVLVVHMLPGIVAAFVMGYMFQRWRQPR